MAPVEGSAFTAVVSGPLEAPSAFDLSGLPKTMTIGTPLSQQRGAIYARMIAEGVLPGPEPRAHESALDYLRRAVAQFSDELDISTQIEFTSAAVLGVSLESERASVIVMFCVQADGDIFDIIDFDQATRAVDAQLAASLVRHVTVASSSSCNGLGPAEVLDLDESILNEDFFDDIRLSLREEGRATTGSEIRQYLRDTDPMRTGSTRRLVGAHHERLRRYPNGILSPDECRSRLDILKPREKRLAAALVDIAESFRTLSNVVRDISTEESQRLCMLNDEAWFPYPRFVLETSAQQRVTEIIDDTCEQVYQSGTLAPNLCVVVTDCSEDIIRLQRAFAVYRQVDAIVRRLRAAIDRYHQEALCPS